MTTHKQNPAKSFLARSLILGLMACLLLSGFNTAFAQAEEQEEQMAAGPEQKDMAPTHLLPLKQQLVLEKTALMALNKNLQDETMAPKKKVYQAMHDDQQARVDFLMNVLQDPAAHDLNPEAECYCICLKGYRKRVSECPQEGGDCQGDCVQRSL